MSSKGAVVGVTEGDSSGTDVGVGVGVAEGSTLGGVVLVGFGDGVAAGVGVEVTSGVGVTVGVEVDVGVEVAVGVGVGVLNRVRQLAPKLATWPSTSPWLVLEKNVWVEFTEGYITERGRTESCAAEKLWPTSCEKII